MSFYASYPPIGGGGVPIYATFTDFPAGGTAGALAVAADTGILYEWSGSAWQVIGGPGVVTSIGAFGSTPNANGLSIASNALSMQPADGTHPGGVSITTQTFAGNKTFTGTVTGSAFISGGTNPASAGVIRLANAEAIEWRNGLNSNNRTLSLDSSNNLTTNATSFIVTGLSGVKSPFFISTNADYSASVGSTGTVALHNLEPISWRNAGDSADFNLYLNGSNILFSDAPITSAGNVLGANLSGTNTGNVTLGTANGLSLVGQALSLALASTSTTGALSSTDWNTFNGKGAGSVTSVQVAVPSGMGVSGGPITGSGTITLTTALTNTNLSGSAAISNANLATMASTSSTAGTVKGNISGSSAVPSDIALASANTASSVVYRDGSGNFSAGTITAALSGNATTATTATTATNIAGGSGGSIPYQSAAGTTALLANGSASQVLTSAGGTSAPTWNTPLLPNHAVTSKTAAYTTLATNNVITFDMSGSSNASYAVTLLTAVGNAGLEQTLVVTVGTGILSVNTTSGQTIGGIASGVIKIANVGDSITVVADGANWQIAQWNISVGVRYHGATATVTGSDSAVTYSTKDFDVYGAYSGATFTAPMAGKYQFNAKIVVTDASGVHSLQLTIYKNGTSYASNLLPAVPSTTQADVLVSDILPLTAGETVQIQVNDNGTSPSIVANNIRNYLSIERVGS